jgi:hypothetical protein
MANIIKALKRARVNQLSEMISKYFDQHKNCNDVVGGIVGDEFSQWLKELDKLNKELGYN